MENESYKILSHEDRAQMEERLLRDGSAVHEKNPKAALYFAERAMENRNAPLALGWLLQAMRLGRESVTVPDAVLEHYRQACERTTKEYLLADGYSGALLLGREYFIVGETEKGIYYLTLAADSTEDRQGVAARILADRLTDELKYRTLQQHYDALAAQKGMPDALCPEQRRRNTSGFFDLDGGMVAGGGAWLGRI